MTVHMASIKQRCAWCTGSPINPEGNNHRCVQCGRLSNLHDVDEPEQVEE